MIYVKKDGSFFDLTGFRMICVDQEFKVDENNIRTPTGKWRVVIDYGTGQTYWLAEYATKEAAQKEANKIYQEYERQRISHLQKEKGI